MTSLKPDKTPMKEGANRKPGRPFKTQTPKPPPDTVQSLAAEPLHDEGAPLPTPPSITFRSFKISLSVFKDQDSIPSKLDRSAWSNKLYSTSLRDVVATYRFLGLIDETSAPTPMFATIIAAFETPTWPASWRNVLQQSYTPLLAADIASLTAGGLLRTFRSIYRTQGEDTRKCCNFFIHASREAALNTGPFLLTNARSRFVEVGRVRRKAPNAPVERETDGSTGDSVDQNAVTALLEKLPPYDGAWPDDVKRLWFEAYGELLQRLTSSRPGWYARD